MEPKISLTEAVHGYQITLKTLMTLFNQWAKLYLNFQDGELTADEVVYEFNKFALPFGVELFSLIQTESAEGGVLRD